MARWTTSSRNYPLTRFSGWLIKEAKLNPSTSNCYVSMVRQALSAIGGNYADGNRLGEYLAVLPPSRYQNTVTAWRRFTAFLRTQGKYAYELTPVTRDQASSLEEGGEEGLDASVRALREVYVWSMTDGRRIGANRLMRARFVERRGPSWVIQFLEAGEPPTVCDAKLTPALNLLFNRAGRPADPRDCLVWPQTPGSDTTCSVPEIRRLLGRLLVTVGGALPASFYEQAPKPERVVIPPLPGMDGKW